MKNNIYKITDKQVFQILIWGPQSSCETDAIREMGHICTCLFLTCCDRVTWRFGPYSLVSYWIPDSVFLYIPHQTLSDCFPPFEAFPSDRWGLYLTTCTWFYIITGWEGPCWSKVMYLVSFLCIRLWAPACSKKSNLLYCFNPLINFPLWLQAHDRQWLACQAAFLDIGSGTLGKRFYFEIQILLSTWYSYREGWCVSR